MELLGFIVLVFVSVAITTAGIVMTIVGSMFRDAETDLIGFCVLIFGLICLYLTIDSAPFHLVQRH